MTVALITRPFERDRFERDLVEAFARQPQTTVVDFDSWQSRRLAELPPDCATAIVFIPFKYMEAAEPIDWHGFSGQRVMLDHDSFHDFTTWGGPLNGRWTHEFFRQKFDSLVCSGLISRDHFESQGIPCQVMHKGFTPSRFYDLNNERSGLCSYGSPYRSRMAMLRQMRTARVGVSYIQSSYGALNVSLNQFAGFLTTVRGSTVRFGRTGRAIERYRPGTCLRYEDAPEPMAKHFEAAATGCAVFTDQTNDLAYLGFRDGESVVAFSNFDDLIDRARFYLVRPDLLRDIGRRSASLCRVRHTWDVRIRDLYSTLKV